METINADGRKQEDEQVLPVPEQRSSAVGDVLSLVRLAGNLIPFGTLRIGPLILWQMKASEMDPFY
jgi:uncharacterized Tic20 family protein